MRDILYDGNPNYEKGAVVCRVAPTFIRFGNFELFSAQNDLESLKSIADFTIKYYFPDITKKGRDKYVQFFKLVANKTREMIIHWQRVGFVHGVMNTDNMSILGLTIDYGPYGWMDDYDENWTPNTTDNKNKRYRFGNQSEVAQWNLYQLANALYPLIGEAKPLEKILNNFKKQYEADYIDMMRSKLGFGLKSRLDKKIITDLTKLMQKSETDMTIFFRELSRVKKNFSPGCGIAIIDEAFYNPSEINKELLKSWGKWFKNYIQKINLEVISDEQRNQNMNKVNPKYVLRNYMSQIAIEAANNDDYSIIIELYNLLKNPYKEQPEFEKWYVKRPDWAKYQIGSSMLSCSS
jgi:uncharacterized protein YdiU (UPF0061 family)